MNKTPQKQKTGARRSDNGEAFLELSWPSRRRRVNLSKVSGGWIVEVPLTRGKVAIIDAQDAPEVFRYKWYASKQQGWTFYAVTSIHKEGRQTALLMHRLILDPPPGIQVDHRNRNGLDNRRCNLRILDKSNQQRHNSKVPSHSISGLKGVSYAKGSWLKNRKWRARIVVDGHEKRLGYFNTKEEAAAAYDAVALHYFGEFARTNQMITAG
jgi:hypothetical protein